MSDNVYPEDHGTNSDIKRVHDADFDDAANQAAALHNPNATDFVEYGMHVTLNGDGTCNVTSGKAYVSADAADMAQSTESRSNVTYTVETDARNSVDLFDGAVNYLYVNVLLTSNDAVEFVAVTSESDAPSDPSLKIADIDLS